jgi:hypothetical protein
MTFAADIVDWGALWQVVYISAISGILIATVLGVGISASLRSSEPGANAVVLRGVTAISVVIVAAAIVVGLWFMFDK